MSKVHYFVKDPGKRKLWVKEAKKGLTDFVFVILNKLRTIFSLLIIIDQTRCFVH